MDAHATAPARDIVTVFIVFTAHFGNLLAMLDVSIAHPSYISLPGSQLPTVLA